MDIPLIFRVGEYQLKKKLIIMTSIVGSKAIAKGGSNRIGFTFKEEHEDKYSTLKYLVIRILES